MQKAGVFLIALFGITPPIQAALPASTESPAWRAFADDRYGTRVQYPNWFSVAEGQPELGPGKRFVTPDRRAEIEIYSLPNSSGYTPRSYLAGEMKINPATVHYRRVAPRFFALSAARGGKIYYTRCNFSRIHGGTIHCVYLGYPEAEKRTWDDIVTRVSFSLRP
jgi:hypothetical protein